MSRRAPLLSAPNENVLSVPSRNVLLTRSVWGGGFRDTSHDAKGPGQTGGIPEGEEGADHAEGGGGRDWAKRTSCTSTAEETKRQRRCGHRAWIEGRAIQPEDRGEGEASRHRDSERESLCRVRTDAGDRVPGRQTQHTRR